MELIYVIFTSLDSKHFQDSVKKSINLYKILEDIQQSLINYLTGLITEHRGMLDKQITKIALSLKPLKDVMSILANAKEQPSKF